MGAVKSAVAELFGLFVDDGSLAMAAIVWVVLGAICTREHVLSPGSVALLLFLGLAALLVENVGRTARTWRRKAGGRQ